VKMSNHKACVLHRSRAGRLTTELDRFKTLGVIRNAIRLVQSVEGEGEPEKRRIFFVRKFHGRSNVIEF
jgi:hypothetical protein